MIFPSTAIFRAEAFVLEHSIIQSINCYFLLTDLAMCQCDILSGFPWMDLNEIKDIICEFTPAGLKHILIWNLDCFLLHVLITIAWIITILYLGSHEEGYFLEQFDYFLLIRWDSCLFKFLYFQAVLSSTGFY